MSVKICVLIGLPAVGKTTFANLISSNIAEQDANNIHTLVISYDDLMPEEIKFDQHQEMKLDQHSDVKFGQHSEIKLDQHSEIKFDQHSEIKFDQHQHPDNIQIVNNYDSITGCDASWKGYRQNILKFVQNLISYLTGTLTEPVKVSRNCCCPCFKLSERTVRNDLSHIIIIDDNMYYRSMRYCFYQLAREMECSFCQLYLHCDVDELIERNVQRHCKMVTKETIIKMSKLIEEPDGEKYSWETNSMSLFTMNQKSSINLESILGFLTDVENHKILAIDPLVEQQKAIDREVCLKNILHQIDQILRKAVSEQMKSEMIHEKNKKLLQDKGKMLNMKRKVFFEQLKVSVLSEMDIQVEEGLLNDNYKEEIVNQFVNFVG